MNALPGDGMVAVNAGEAVTSVSVPHSTMPALCVPGTVSLSIDASAEMPKYDEMEQPSKTSPSDVSSTTTTNGQTLPLAPFSTVSTACLGCRGKHLKCDGHVPCSRCQLAEVECVYVASRRGYKGPRKPNKRLRSSSSSPPPPTTVQPNVTVPLESCPMMLGAPRTVMSSAVSLPVVMTTSMTAPMAMPMTVASTSYSPPLPVSDTDVTIIGSMPSGYTTAGSLAGLPSTATTLVGPNMAVATSTSTPIGSTPVAMSQMNLYRNPFSNGLDGANFGVGGNMALSFTAPPVSSIEDRCFDAFYHFFFGGHPFVLPREVLLSVAKESSSNIAHLVAAIRYIGSLYIDAGPTRARLFDEAIRLAYLPNCPKDGFLVQTLLMLIVGLDGNCEQERARQLLADCERIAVEIGLNHRDFASTHGRGSPVFEESWRRTWWDLFVVDGMVAGVHRMTNFFLFDIPADVALPCEEQQYLSGNIPTPPYIEDFDDQLFSGEEREFSSFAYRIAAARILGRFMRCPPILYSHDENLEKIESLLSNWRMHLPASKRDSLTKTCQPDEMIFQAHFITHACSILLHQPHSQLDSSPTRSVTSCAPHSQVPSGDAFNTHTKHTITAACEISKMVTQAVPLLSHTHFFTCVITLSSIVHLSKWALYFIQDEEDLRQQIRLNIGALSKLSEVWRAANTAGGQVKGVAQEIYRAKKAQQINPAFWVGFTQEEMISSINADESIMSEFDNMMPVTTQ